MTNLTLQPYSTKLAKHQPPDWRHPTEKKKKRKKEKEKKQQQQKTRACPGVTAGGESEQSSPLDGQR